MEKKFDCTAKRIDDIMKAIDVIRPVISLIKTLDDKEKKCMSLIEEAKSDGIDNKTLNDTLSSISNKDMKKEVNLILDKYASRELALKDKIEKLESELQGIRNQIQQYLDYTDSFFYIGIEEITQDLLGKAISEESSLEDFFIILLILRNDCVQQYEDVESKAYEYADDVKDEFRKHILKHLEGYAQGDICNLIKEN